MHERHQAVAGSLRSTAELRQVFTDFDTDGSGSISSDELESVAKRLNINLEKEQLDALMLDVRTPKPPSLSSVALTLSAPVPQIDVDQSGVIEFDEFVQLVNRADCGVMEEIIATRV